MSSSLECCVCFEKGATLPCSHVVCSDCLLAWKSKSNTCPQCRRELARRSPPPPQRGFKIVTPARRTRAPRLEFTPSAPAPSAPAREDHSVFIPPSAPPRDPRRACRDRIFAACVVCAAIATGSACVYLGILWTIHVPFFG